MFATGAVLQAPVPGLGFPVQQALCFAVNPAASTTLLTPRQPPHGAESGQRHALLLAKPYVHPHPHIHPSGAIRLAHLGERACKQQSSPYGLRYGILAPAMHGALVRTPRRTHQPREQSLAFPEVRCAGGISLRRRRRAGECRRSQHAGEDLCPSLCRVHDPAARLFSSRAQPYISMRP